MFFKIANIMVALCLIVDLQATEELYTFLSEGRVRVNDGIERVPDSYFEGRSDIIEVVFPNSLKNIGEYCFSNCQNLSKIVVPFQVVSFLRNWKKDELRSTDIWEEERLVRESVGIDHVDYVAYIDRQNNIVTINIGYSAFPIEKAAEKVAYKSEHICSQKRLGQEDKKPKRNDIRYYSRKKNAL